MADTIMTCPKCSGAWKTLERKGVVIDECTGCQGVFLDRGELEQLIDAESEYLAKLDPAADPDWVLPRQTPARHHARTLHVVRVAAPRSSASHRSR